MVRPQVNRAEMALQRAHQLLNSSQPQEAAQLFHMLADGLDQKGMPVRAVMVRLQAAYAEALAGLVEQAVHSTNNALSHPVSANIPNRVANATQRVIDVFRQKGQTKEAGDLEKKVEELVNKAGFLQGQRFQLKATESQHHGELPAKCPSCGGPLLPDEVEWHDAGTASCNYCGSAIKTF